MNLEQRLEYIKKHNKWPLSIVDYMMIVITILFILFGIAVSSWFYKYLGNEKLNSLFKVIGLIPAMFAAFVGIYSVYRINKRRKFIELTSTEDDESKKKIILKAVQRCLKPVHLTINEELNLIEIETRGSMLSWYGEKVRIIYFENKILLNSRSIIPHAFSYMNDDQNVKSLQRQIEKISKKSLPLET